MTIIKDHWMHHGWHKNNGYFFRRQHCMMGSSIPGEFFLFLPEYVCLLTRLGKATRLIFLSELSLHDTCTNRALGAGWLGLGLDLDLDQIRGNT